MRIMAKKKTPKLVLGLIAVVVAALIVVPTIWSLSPSGAVRARLLIGGHPLKAVVVTPVRSYDTPAKSGVIYAYKDRLFYRDSNGTGTFAAMAVTKNGVFYHARPLLYLKN